MLFWHKILSFSFVHITKFVFYLIIKHIFVDIMSNIEQGNFLNTTYAYQSIGEFVFWLGIQQISFRYNKLLVCYS